MPGRQAWSTYCHSKLVIAFKPLLSTSLHINKILLTSFLEFDKKKITRLPCNNSYKQSKKDHLGERGQMGLTARVMDPKALVLLVYVV